MDQQQDADYMLLGEEVVENISSVFGVVDRFILKQNTDIDKKRHQCNLHAGARLYLKHKCWKRPTASIALSTLSHDHYIFLRPPNDTLISW